MMFVIENMHVLSVSYITLSCKDSLYVPRVVLLYFSEEPAEEMELEK